MFSSTHWFGFPNLIFFYFLFWCQSCFLIELQSFNVGQPNSYYPEFFQVSTFYNTRKNCLRRHNFLLPLSYHDHNPVQVHLSYKRGEKRLLLRSGKNENDPENVSQTNLLKEIDPKYGADELKSSLSCNDAKGDYSTASQMYAKDPEEGRTNEKFNSPRTYSRKGQIL